jgi:hypothetical protein
MIWYRKAKNDTINQPQDLYNAENQNPTRPLLEKVQKFQIDEGSKTDKRRYKEGKYNFIKYVYFLINKF